MCTRLRERLDLQRLREVILDPGDRSRDSPQAAVSNRHLRQAPELLALQQPVVDLPQDERRQHRDVLRRIEEPHQSEEPVEEWRLQRAHVERPPVVIVRGCLPARLHDQCRELARVHA